MRARSREECNDVRCEHIDQWAVRKRVIQARGKLTVGATVHETGLRYGRGLTN